MKYVLTILLFFGVISSFAQRIEKREIASFDKIEVTGNIDVEMYLGNQESIEVKAYDISTSEVITVVEDKLLKIKINSSLFDEDLKIKVKVSYKELREITSNASANITVKDVIKGDKIFAEATSGGRIIMEVDLNAIELKAYQGAQINIEGTCKIQESYINTGAILSASNFACDEVFIQMNTRSKAEIIANNKIDAKVNTWAELSFFGLPSEENLKTSMGGDIIKWDEK